MRNIKFRCWNVREEIMFGGIPALDNLANSCGKDTSTLKFMQYTEIQDKNKKEIYDGDIIKEITDYDSTTDDDNLRYRCLVFWGNGEWLVSPLEGAVGIPLSEAHFKGEGIEVIGNIYQNPELLN